MRVRTPRAEEDLTRMIRQSMIVQVVLTEAILGFVRLLKENGRKGVRDYK